MICRHQLAAILQTDGQITVVGEGCRGEEALALIERLQPDILVIDLVMPGQGGQETIAHVMAKHPLPILVLTAQPEGVRQVAVFDAIRRGALELAEKPRRGDKDAEERLRRSIRTLACIPVVRHVAGNLAAGPQRSSGTTLVQKERPSENNRSTRERAAAARSSSAPPESSGTAVDNPTLDSEQPGEPLDAQSKAERQGEAAWVVGIGASAGGPTPLATLLGGLPRNFPAPIAVVQHLPVGFMDAFAEYLRGRIALAVKKVEGRETMRPGVVYLAADDRHLMTTSGGNIAISSAPAVEGHRPSVDVLFDSLAKTHGRRGIGIILSGIGQDGVRGLLAMREQGALTLAQSEQTCAVFGMPQAALNWGAARQMLSPEAMAVELQRYAAVQNKWRVAR